VTTDLRGYHVEVVWYNDGSGDSDSDDVSIPDERPALPAAIRVQIGHTARVGTRYITARLTSTGSRRTWDYKISRGPAISLFSLAGISISRSRRSVILSFLIAVASPPPTLLKHRCIPSRLETSLPKRLAQWHIPLHHRRRRTMDETQHQLELSAGPGRFSVRSASARSFCISSRTRARSCR
jgi:hypothetical protein